MIEIILDGYEMKTKEEAHNHLIRQLELPDYYGKNLDALYDILTAISEKTQFVMLHLEALLIEACSDKEAFLQIFWDAEAENNQIQVVVKVEL